MGKMREKADGKMSIYETLRNVSFVWKYLYHANKKLYFVRIPLLIIDILSSLVSMAFLRIILNELTSGRNMKIVVSYAVGLAVANFTISLVRRVFNVYDSRQLEETNYNIKLMLAKAVSQMPFSDIEEPRMKDFIFLAESSDSFSKVIDYTTSFLSSLINVITYTSIVLYVQPLILVLIVAVLIIQTVIYKLKRDDEYRWRTRQAPIFRRRNYFINLLSDIRYGKEIRLNKLQSYFVDKGQSYFNEACIPVLKKAVFSEKGLQFITEFANVIQTFFVYLILGLKVVFQGMPIGDFSLFLSSTNKLTGGLSGIVGSFSNLLTCGVFAKDFRYCITLSEQKKKAFGNAVVPDGNELSIEFRNVSFKYPHTENYVLKNVSFILRQGERLSLVGINGSGKSTLVKLLCRFYEPTEGTIFIGGVNANTLSADEYSRLLGVVFQDFKLFSFSISENISMDEETDDQRIRFSIENSGLSEKITGLEKGLETSLDKQFDEDGIEFSGGEAQKLAIARAVYKNAPIIILDEPTAALDPIAEYEIYKHFNNLSEGKTTIYISHRLSSTRFTDKIAVLSDGKLCEFGSHKELMSIENGLYRKMFNMQAQYYN